MFGIFQVLRCRTVGFSIVFFPVFHKYRVDPVARFHLRNGARLERLNWLGDVSENGLQRSAGMMVNYLYARGDIEKNHEAYMADGKIAMSSDFKSLSRSERGGDSPLKKLGFG